MKIAVSDIPEEGQYIEFNENLRFDSATSKTVPVTATLRLRKDGQTVHIRGHIRAEIAQECSRCLTVSPSVLDFDFSAAFEPASMESGEAYELSGVDLDLGSYENDEIDLADLIGEQLMINIPIKPLCSESCKGICSRCGANRNRDECFCEGTEIDDRWKILGNLFSERKT